jgi:hypothetical protein
MGFKMSIVYYMLNKEYPYLPTKQGDLNLYILSKLSSYNIMIAYLLCTQKKGAIVIITNNMQYIFLLIK